MPAAVGDEAEADLKGLAFPIVAFWLDFDERGERRNERFRRFRDTHELGVATGRDMRLDRQLGTLIVDAAGRALEIASVTRTGFVTPLWLRILMRFMRDADSVAYTVEYGLLARPPMVFDEVKARVGASIQQNRDDWVDDEAMAGEAAEPLKLDDVIAGAMEAVREATTMQNLFERLDAAWPY